MTITPPKQNPEDFVDKNPVPVSTEKWGKFGFYDKTLAKGPKQQLGFGTYTQTHTILTSILVI